MTSTPKVILVDAWNTFATETGINKDMQALLDSFSNKKIILTNANPEEKVKFWIVDMPYPVFSLEHNPNKTDSEYFTKFLAEFWLSADDVIYFEHNPEAVESAKSIWITAHRYDKDKKDLDSLAEFLKKTVD